MKWANETLRQIQSNHPWTGWVADSVKQQYLDAGWKEVADSFEFARTDEEIQADIKRNMTSFVQSILDFEAVNRGYDNIVSATSYAGYPNQFQAEGISFGVWRSAVWTKCYEIMAEVLAGNRAVPTEAELIAELPKL